MIFQWVELFYKEEIDEKNPLIEIDYRDFNAFLSAELNKTPFSINFENILSAISNKISTKYGFKPILKIVEYPINDEIRVLDKNHIGKFITATVMIKNISQLKFKMTYAVYECKGCGKTYTVNVDGEAAPILGRCSECGNKSYTLLKESSKYENYKYLKLVEPLEMRRGGETREFKAKVEGYLASPEYSLKAGDICNMAGYFDIVVTDKGGLEPLINIYNINPINSSYDDIKLTEGDIAQIKEYSEQENLFKVFCDSIAPSVHGYDYIKEALVLQMFEGARPSNYTNFNDRYTIHILLIGDPGLGKSKILEEVYDRSPRAIKANGAGTTQAGLTATAVKDEITGSWSMEAGASVLADGGVLIIDEFDKLNHHTMKSLNEPMEQLSVSVAKAGLVQTMSARTSVLAGANPKYSRFDMYKSYEEQLNIPQSTLSRFDIVFAMTDSINYKKDYQKAMDILTGDFNDDKEILDKEFIRKYVAYAKNNIFPTMDYQIIHKISEFYATTRQLANNNEDIGKPISMREMGAVYRLAIARAKLSLREFVIEEDVDCAIRIYTNSLKSLGLSLETAGAIQNIYSDLEISLIKESENYFRGKLDWTKDDVKSLLLDLIEEYDIDINLARRCAEIGKNNIQKERNYYG